MVSGLDNKRAGDRVKGDLINQIKTGQLLPNSAILAERKLAERYKVSYMTVRRAINDLVEMGLLYRVPCKGTFIAGNEKIGTLNKAHVIAYITADLKNSFNMQIIDAIERKARHSGFQLMIYNSELNPTLEANHLKSMIGSNVSGVILFPCFPPLNRAVVTQFLHTDIPLVMVDKHFLDINTDYVEFNNFEGALQATNYLISLGHRRIGHITSHSSLKHISSIQARYEGYLKALKDHNIEFRPEYVQGLDEISVHTEWNKINLNYLGYCPMKQLLDLPEPPSAVFLLYSSIYIGASRAIREKGLSIPRDMSIMGFNDDEITPYMDVPLTTMAQSLTEMGEWAFALLHDRINGKANDSNRKLLNSQLLIRNSCSAWIEK